jgi:membrane associated rhomboid family serine protease
MAAAASIVVFVGLSGACFALLGPASSASGRIL